ncbi:tetratricopeptide repeat protein [Sphingopyxis sp.]|uniref:tetratricopeptide repeat protein n=1 Tax=Sphingopyxis sp. TaxID=1908224 RepID=UPI003BAB56AD
MALSPNNNAAFLQEVDEAVRKDRIDRIARNYGRWIVGGVIAALMAFAAYLYWGHRQDIARGEKGEELIAALEQVKGNQPTAATAALKKLEGEGNPAYRAAALIQQSNMKAEKGDIKAAVAMLAQVAGDTKLDQSLRDMALVRQTALEFDTLKPQAVIARLKPIVDAKDPQSSWFASAAELTAAAYYQSGQFDQAGALYGRIAKLPGVAKTLQSRSVQMAGMLGVDAITDRAAESAKADTNKAAQSAAGDQKGTPGAAAAAKTEEAK